MVGSSRHLASPAARRADQPVRPDIDTGVGGTAVGWHEPRPELRDGESPHRPASLHAFGQRHLLRVGAALPAPDRRGMARTSGQGLRARGRRWRALKV